MNSRACTKCEQTKDLTPEFFHRRKGSKIGFMEQCKTCRNENSRHWYTNNKERVKTYKTGRRNIINKQMSEWRKNNKDKYNEHKRDQYHRLQKHSPQYKIKDALRKRIRHAVTKGHKSASTLALLGCTVEALKRHLESQWTEGMTWDTYGHDGWHIDHIKPCAAFDLTDEEQQKECFHHTNLQPLWAADNLEKSDNYE